jgi:hypothetical protein
MTILQMVLFLSVLHWALWVPREPVRPETLGIEYSWYKRRSKCMVRP